MAADLFLCKKTFAERLTYYFQKRITAVLLREGIEYYRNNLHDLIAEVYSTAAV